MHIKRDISIQNLKTILRILFDLNDCWTMCPVSATIQITTLSVVRKSVNLRDLSNNEWRQHCR